MADTIQGTCRVLTSDTSHGTRRVPPCLAHHKSMQEEATVVLYCVCVTDVRQLFAARVSPILSLISVETPCHLYTISYCCGLVSTIAHC